MDSAQVSCAPRELVSTQASAWSSTGRHGHTTRTASRQQCKDVEWSEQKNLFVATVQASKAVASQQGPSAGLVTLVYALPSDIVAHIFLFSHLADVLNCAGLTCRTMNLGVWQQVDFWIALGGPAFVEVLTPAAPPPMDATLVLAAFRRGSLALRATGAKSSRGLQRVSCRLQHCKMPMTACKAFAVQKYRTKTSPGLCPLSCMRWSA